MQMCISAEEWCRESILLADENGGGEGDMDNVFVKMHTL